MVGKIKQAIENKIIETITMFLKEQMFEDVQEMTTEIVHDAIIIRFKGVLTPAERQLGKGVEGAQLINELKGKLIEGARSILEPLIEDITGAKVVDIHFSSDIKTGEHIGVITLDKDLEKACEI